jgi:hypothetical protein
MIPNSYISGIIFSFLGYRQKMKKPGTPAAAAAGTVV